MPQASVLPSGSLTVAAALARARSRGQVSISFEFFPPRDDAGEVTLWSAIRAVEAVSPSFVSVTYGAGGGTQDRTVRVTQRIAAETTLTPLAHLTCVGRSTAELRHVVGAYANAGVRSVLALRGDPPGGPGGSWTAHPHGLDRAVDLVRLIGQLGTFSVGVAAFPDGHPESPSLAHDIDVLAWKAEAGAEFAVTQFFFEAEPYLRLRDALAARGVDMPVLPGVMPLTNAAQVKRFATLSGSGVPGWLSAQIDAAGDDADRIRMIGVEAATALCRRLLAEGVPGLHFYTLNRSRATMDVHQRLGLPRGS